MSHSPAPWKINWTIAGGGAHEDFPELHYANIHSANYLEVAPHGLSITGYITKDDARLIAAAPELLEALTRQVQRCSCPYGDCLTCEQSKLAIAKASPATECSICRREHGREIVHEAE